jgi:hypothetical protein
LKRTLQQLGKIRPKANFPVSSLHLSRNAMAAAASTLTTQSVQLVEFPKT